MNQEERKEKRKQDTQKAIVTFSIFLVIIVAIVIGAIVVVQKFVKPNINSTKQESVQDTETEADTEIPVETEVAETVDPLWQQASEYTNGLTLEQKVAQMFMVTPDELTGFSGVTAAGDTTKTCFTQYPVGGMIYMSNNLTGTDQTTQMLTNMQAYSQEITGLPIFLGVDEEGGSVSRIASNSAYGVTDVGNMSDVGATGDSQNAYNAGSTIGAYLHGFGFNLDFAPVADVLSNPDNTVVATRSFGSDSQVVSDMVCAEMKGLSDQQILSAVKHFPGHGATAEDSHDGYASTDKSLEELTGNELVPFQQAINNGASFVMVGHISVPTITGDNTPSSLSSMMVTDVLRNQMGFNGIIITDAMNMGAITEQYSSADAAVAAINAGVDMVLMSDDFAAAYQGVLDAVTSGTISEERINESVTRIIKVKLAM